MPHDDEIQGPWLPSRRALAAIGSYFGVLLIPSRWPGFANTGVYFFCELSLPFAFLVLLAFAAWGTLGMAFVRYRGSSVNARYRLLLGSSFVGFLSLGAAIGLTYAIDGDLPTGSHVLEFSRPAWLDPQSSEYVRGDITPRQKMLGSAVAQLTPALTRADIEERFGPSLDTPYFAETDRDLIYVLGPERGAFGIDSEWLLIWLDDSDHFVRYGIYTD